MKTQIRLNVTTHGTGCERNGLKLIDVSIIEWMADNRDKLDQLTLAEKEFHHRIDDYVRLVETIQYWCVQADMNEEALLELQCEREREVVHMLADLLLRVGQQILD